MTIALRGALLLSLLWGVGALAQDPPDDEPPPRPARWKAVQVLPADVSEETMQRTMEEMSRGLGVRCAFCHEPDDPARETPIKQTARTHLKMVVELGRDTFAYAGAPRVTCAMCHRGRKIPRVR